MYSKIIIGSRFLTTSAKIPPTSGCTGWQDLDLYRVAKFNPKVGNRRTTKIKNLVILVIILGVLILLPYYMYVVLSFLYCCFIGKEKDNLKDLLG